jgi:hypothetical protein
MVLKWVLVEHQTSQYKKKIKDMNCGAAIGQIAMKPINVTRVEPKTAEKQRMKSYITSTKHIKINCISLMLSTD